MLPVNVRTAILARLGLTLGGNGREITSLGNRVPPRTIDELCHLVDSLIGPGLKIQVEGVGDIVLSACPYAFDTKEVLLRGLGHEKSAGDYPTRVPLHFPIDTFSGKFLPKYRPGERFQNAKIRGPMEFLGITESLWVCLAFPVDRKVLARFAQEEIGFVFWNRSAVRKITYPLGPYRGAGQIGLLKRWYRS